MWGIGSSARIDHNSNPNSIPKLGGGCATKKNVAKPPCPRRRGGGSQAVAYNSRQAIFSQLHLDKSELGWFHGNLRVAGISLRSRERQVERTYLTPEPQS